MAYSAVVLAAAGVDVDGLVHRMQAGEISKEEVTSIVQQALGKAEE